MAKITDVEQVMAYLRQARETQWEYEKVKARFEHVNAPAYGEGMSAWVPDFEYAHELILTAIGLHLPNGGKVLDLGAGSGRFTKRILEYHNNFQVTLVDFSENMLDEAHNTLHELVGRYQIHCGDFFSAGVNFPSNSFDCVVSVFAICHGRNVEVYNNLYQRVCHWLKPGGCFICYDHVLGDTEKFTLLNVVGWKQFMDLCWSADRVRDAIVSTYQEDSPLSLQRHIRLLSDAGFGAVDVLYKKDIFAIYAGVKS